MALVELFNLIKNIAFIASILILVFVIYLYMNQNKMIYMPEVQGMGTNDIGQNPFGYRSPADIKLPFKEIRIKTVDNLTLYGWFVYNKKSEYEEITSTPTIIYFHENAGNIGFRIPFIDLLVRQIKANVLLVGYRGYGYSEGTPTEEGIMLDSEAVLDYVFNKESEISDVIDKNNVYIFGRSLGGAVSLYIADKLKPKIKGIILENTFSSMGDMVDHLFPLLKRVKNLLLSNKWPSKDRIVNLKYPILFISSERDELVPFRHMEDLYNRAVNVAYKNKFIIYGGTHNESWQKVKSEYVKQLENFMIRCNGEIYDNILGKIDDEILINSGSGINSDTLNCGEDINMEDDTVLIDKKYE